MHRVRKRQAGTAGNDVIPHRSSEQEVFLQNNAEALSQMPKIDFAKIRTVHLDEAAVVAIDPLQQARDCGFSGAATPDDAQHGSCGYRKADLIESRHLVARIVERYVLKANGARENRSHPAGIVLQGAVQYRPDFANGRSDLLAVFNQFRQINERRSDACAEHHEGEQ
jgi:hypothetical protein